MGWIVEVMVMGARIYIHSILFCNENECIKDLKV
tara:strand:+ start:3875 stop:3976 length:102 start_codon:yes stop_codon:yes gene_type:complete